MALLGVGVTAAQLVTHGLNADGAVGLLLFVGLLLALVRGLVVRFEPPRGIVLDPATHPALFARVDELRRRVGAPPLDEIRLDARINAAVALTPRGLLPPRRTLILGLPLLMLETPEEAATTIAHELGHVYGGDDRAAARAARWEMIWLRLAEGVGAGGIFSRALFAPFFVWYGSWLDKRLRPLRRHRERAADAVAAHLVGSRAMASGLVRDALANLRLEYEVFPAFRRRAAQAMEGDEGPPAHALEELVAALAAPWPEAQGRLWLRAALTLPTVDESTHPALADRLAALGVEPPDEPPPPAQPTAAQELLGAQGASVAAAVGALWVKDLAKDWAEESAREREARARLAELDRVAGRAELPLEEVVEHALLAAERRPAREALPLLRRAAEAAPERADVAVALGFALLDVGSENGAAGEGGEGDEGARLLGRWLPRLPERMGDGLWRLLLDRCRRGLGDEARELAARLARWPEEWAEFQRERSGFTARDELAPHDLDREALGVLAAELSGHPEVRRAWVVLKVVKALPEVPCRFLVVETTVDGERVRPGTARRALVEALEASPRLPPHTTVLVAESGFHEGTLSWVGLAERVRGALIYERPDAD